MGVASLCLSSLIFTFQSSKYLLNRAFIMILKLGKICALNSLVIATVACSDTNIEVSQTVKPPVLAKI